MSAVSAPEPEDDKVNWSRYTAALRRYKWMMLLIVLLGTSGGVVATRFLPPEYTARGTIWLEEGGGKSGPIRPNELLVEQGWIELLRTYVVFDPVVHRMRLYINYENRADSIAFTGFEIADKFHTGKFTLRTDPTGTRWTLLRDGAEVGGGSVGDSIGTKLGWVWAPTAQQLKKNRTIEFELMNPRQVSNDLIGNLHASMAQENANFLRISLDGTDRFVVAPILNAICQQFVDIAAELKRRKLTEMRVALDSQLVIANKNLRDAETKLNSFRVQTMTEPNPDAPIPSGLTTTDKTVTGDYFAKKLQLDAIRNDRVQIEAVLSRAKQGAITVDAFQTIAAVRQAPDLVRALGEVSNLEADLRALRYRYTDEYQGIKTDLTNLNTLKTQTIPALAQALIDQLKTQESDLQARIDQAGVELQKVPTRQMEEMRLQRDFDAADGLAKNLNERHEEAKLAELSAIPDLRILDAATTPQDPSSNSAPKIILMSLAASLGLAFGLALLLDQLDRRFRYPEQVSRELGLTILGAIPAIRKGKRGDLHPEEAAQVVEAFRTIRLNLAHSYGAAGPVLLTVSSPGAGDGKSLVSSNLAVSFAEAGYRTLLIDGDIRRGELHRMFAVDRRPGLLDYLIGGTKIDDIIRPTNHRGLSVVPCGTRRHQGPELLGSSAMAQLMAEMKARYNVVIVDSPPLGAGIDPFVLGTATGHLMMVFRSGETDRQMADAKLRLLDRLPVRVLGAVLNDIQAQGVYRYYSYLYGYTSDEEGAPPQLAGKAGENGRGR
jgi:capsular exopolysaccharide synthesis family protein